LMSLPRNVQPASISPPPPISSAGGAEDPDGADGNDDADALSEGTSLGVRNTQLAAMHSANIGIVASNRIVDLLRHRVETAARPQCSRDATPDRVAVGACAGSTRPCAPDCAIARLARLARFA